MHNIIVNDYSKHIAIIGAGISGLALGCILKKANIPVVIFEKSNDVSDYGAGISISPNGIRVLKYLNIYKEVIAFSKNPKEVVFFSGNQKINNFNINISKIKTTTSFESNILLTIYTFFILKIVHNAQLIRIKYV